MFTVFYDFILLCLSILHARKEVRTVLAIFSQIKSNVSTDSSFKNVFFAISIIIILKLFNIQPNIQKFSTLFIRYLTRISTRQKMLRQATFFTALHAQ